MNKDLLKHARIIRSDILTLQKLENDPEFKKKLLRAISTAKYLKADKDLTVFCTYKIYLPSLSKIGFYELTALERFEDENYLSELKGIINDKISFNQESNTIQEKINSDINKAENSHNKKIKLTLIK